MESNITESGWFRYCPTDSTNTTEESSFSHLHVNPCVLSICTFTSHVTFTILALLTLICCRKCNSEDKPRRYPGHSVRWTCLITLFIVTTAAIGERILTESTFSRTDTGNVIPLYFPPGLLLIAIITSLVYYQCTEQRHKPYLCGLSLLYWVSCFTIGVVTLYELYEIEIDVSAFRIWLTLVMVTLFLMLMVIDINLLIQEVIVRSQRTTHCDEYVMLSLKNVKYTEESVNFLYRMTFWWLNWLMRLGFKRPIEIEDLGTLPKNHKAFHLYSRLKEEMRNSRTCSLWKHLYRICKREIILAAFTRLGGDIAAYIGPLALNGIVTYAISYNDARQDDSHYITIQEFFSNGFVLVGVIFISSTLQSTLFQKHIYQCNVIGVHVKTAAQTLVYDKSLNLSSYSLTGGSMTVGEITNHMSMDAMNLLFFCQRIHYLWAIPLKVVTILLLLYYQVNISALFALVVLFVAITLQMLMGRLQSDIQEKIMTHADDRLKKSNELLLGIKLLKLYGWEQMYSKFIEAIRNLEMGSIFKYNTFYGLSVFITIIVPTLSHFAVFISYPYITGNPLQPNSTFAALSFMNLLIEPMYFVPVVTSLVVNGLIAVKRLDKFLKAPEAENAYGRQWNQELQDLIKEKYFYHDSNDDKIDCTESTPLLRKASTNSKTRDNHFLQVSPNESTFTSEIPHPYAIKIDSGTFSWDVNSRPSLTDINLTIPFGKVTMILGPVGSGKSSLLSGMLGEMTTIEGSVSFGGKRANRVPNVAYAAQKAWLINASLKDNITFGKPFDVKRYKRVLEASALEPDIKILPGGDMTEIGEKGINLSGGQKQRVNVARAMYSNRDIVLLDDPLSALDAHVGSHLFHKGIMGRLRKSNRTVVLVTHQLQYLQQADKIVLMHNGQIVLQGSFEDVVKENPNVFEKWRQEMLNETGSETDPTSVSETDTDIDSEGKMIVRKRQRGITSSLSREPNKEKGALVEDEELPRGSVHIGVYIYYAKNMGCIWAFAFLLMAMVYMSFNISRDFWLSKWSEAGLQNSTVSDLNADYLGVYIGLGCGCIVMALFFPLAGVIATWFAAKRLHFNMLRNVTAAPMRFFDTTPVGRVLNRFASDTQIIDTKLIIALMGLNYFFWTLLFAFIINAIISPLFIIELVPVMVIYSLIALFFIRTSRELQRLDSVTKSPVFSHFSETLSGITTIRAYREQSRFFSKLLDLIDTNNAAFIYLKASFGWLGLQLSLCGAVIVLMVGITTLLQAINGVLAASEVGLAISYVLMVSVTMYDFVQGVTETEMQMNPVERVQYYTTIPTENYQGLEPASDWPSSGGIAIDNISVRYAGKLPPVLKDVTIHVRAGEKVGICGRTGSGKSSLALAFFRLIQTFKGQIVIDGEDISKLPLLTLRQRLSIIPQDPVLFNGTIRSNLDPEGCKCDEELWHALDIAQLKEIVSQYGCGLDTLVSEGGDNFSAGQRQLFSLARAFLRNSRVLIMDEATASVDYETERVLQDVVSTAFKTKTVLTIAHRVATILQSDIIWVLNEGKVVECDTPENLLSRSNSLFYSMVQANN